MISLVLLHGRLPKWPGLALVRGPRSYLSYGLPGKAIGQFSPGKIRNRAVPL